VSIPRLGSSRFFALHIIAANEAKFHLKINYNAKINGKK
jgi:hypothetical protein